MTRLVHEIGALQSGVEGHITSDNPIRPENKPDPWEAAALGQIERGEKTEVTSIETVNGREYLRFMGGLMTEKGCLGCHAQQGYKIGDIRGGISVSAPMDKFSATATSDWHASQPVGSGVDRHRFWRTQSRQIRDFGYGPFKAGAADDGRTDQYAGTMP